MYVSVINAKLAAVRGRRGDRAEGEAAMREGLQALGVDASELHGSGWSAVGDFLNGFWLLDSGTAYAKWDLRSGYWAVDLRERLS